MYHRIEQQQLKSCRKNIGMHSITSSDMEADPGKNTGFSSQWIKITIFAFVVNVEMLRLKRTSLSDLFYVNIFFNDVQNCQHLIILTF